MEWREIHIYNGNKLGSTVPQTNRRRESNNTVRGNTIKDDCKTGAQKGSMRNARCLGNRRLWWRHYKQKPGGVITRRLCRYRCRFRCFCFSVISTHTITATWFRSRPEEIHVHFYLHRKPMGKETDKTIYRIHFYNQVIVTSSIIKNSFKKIESFNERNMQHIYGRKKTLHTNFITIQNV